MTTEKTPYSRETIKKTVELRGSRWMTGPLGPLSKVIEHRPMEGFYEVKGERVSIDEMQEVFGVSPKTFRLRTRSGGVPTHAALLLPEQQYAALSPTERWLMSWNHWCEEEEIPTTDEDLRRGRWSEKGPRPQLVDPRQLINGPPKFTVGQELFGTMLLKAGSDPTATMMSWLFAVGLEVGAYVPDKPGVYAPLVLLLDQGTIDLDELSAEETSTLPFLAKNDEWPVRAQSAFYRLTKGWKSEAPPYFESLCEFIGFVVFVRKLLRKAVVLSDVNWLEYRWGRGAHVEDQFLPETANANIAFNNEVSWKVSTDFVDQTRQAIAFLPVTKTAAEADQMRATLKQVAAQENFEVVRIIEQERLGREGIRAVRAELLLAANKSSIDVVLIPSLASLGSSAYETVETLMKLAATIEVKSLAEPWLALSTESCRSFVLWFLDREREKRSQDAKNSLIKAQADGRRIGRPRVPVDVERAKALIREGASLGEAARQCKCGASTLRRALKTG